MSVGRTFSKRTRVRDEAQQPQERPHSWAGTLALAWPGHRALGTLGDPLLAWVLSLSFFRITKYSLALKPSQDEGLGL